VPRLKPDRVWAVAGMLMKIHNGVHNPGDAVPGWRTVLSTVGEAWTVTGEDA